MQFLLKVLKRKGFMILRHIRFRPRLQSCKSFLSAAYFWDVTQRIVVVPNRRFGIFYRSQTQRSRIWIVDPLVSYLLLARSLNHVQ